MDTPTVVAPAPPGYRLAERRITPVAWDTAFEVGGRLEDTLLIRPWLIAAGRNGVFAYDYADARVKAVDRTGSLAWTFGREGEGPGEFRNATDLQVGPDGRVWIVDGGTGRVTILSAGGRLERVLGPFEQPIRTVMPLRGRTLATRFGTEDVLWVELDDAGETSASGSYPTDSLRGASMLARQGKVAVGPRDHWAVIFPFGDAFLVYHGPDLVCRGTLVEGAPLPLGDVRVPDLPVWAVAAALTDSSLLVLPRGRTEHDRRALDEYDAASCAYRRTLPLPVRAPSPSAATRTTSSTRSRSRPSWRCGARRIGPDARGSPQALRRNTTTFSTGALPVIDGSIVKTIGFSWSGGTSHPSGGTTVNSRRKPTGPFRCATPVESVARTISNSGRSGTWRCSVT